MNYDDIAKLVHNSMKNPKGLLSYEQQSVSKEVTNHEYAIIQKVTSKYEISRNTLAIGIIPQGLWG